MAEYDAGLSRRLRELERRVIELSGELRAVRSVLLSEEEAHAWRRSMRTSKAHKEFWLGVLRPLVVAVLVFGLSAIGGGLAFIGRLLYAHFSGSDGG